MINFTSPGDTVVSIGGGKFGGRWPQIAESYGMNAVTVDVEWGEAVSPTQLAETLEAHPDAAMVTVTMSETSTGVLHPIDEVIDVVREKSSALVAVDAITSVGVHRVPMDELGIDVMVAGSQKAFGVPPGAGFVAASDRAWERYEQSKHPRYYFDLGRERDRQVDNQTAFTSPISQVLALDEVMKMMRREGLDGIVHRHAVNAMATRAAIRAAGLSVFAERPANSVTAVRTPEGAAPKIVRRMLESHGARIAGGQKHFKPSLFRLGHIGFFDRSDIINMISALELTLEEVGLDVEPGAAVSAAQSVYAREATATLDEEGITGR